MYKMYCVMFSVKGIVEELTLIKVVVIVVDVVVVIFIVII